MSFTRNLVLALKFCLTSFSPILPKHWYMVNRGSRFPLSEQPRGPDRSCISRGIKRASLYNSFNSTTTSCQCPKQIGEYIRRPSAIKFELIVRKDKKEVSDGEWLLLPRMVVTPTGWVGCIIAEHVREGWRRVRGQHTCVCIGPGNMMRRIPILFIIIVIFAWWVTEMR